MSPKNKWFIFADEDWLMARRAFEDSIFNQVCFHSQQGVEKLLKGLISEVKKRVPRIHSLIELLNICSEIKPELSEFEIDCVKLDRYYIPTRYPDALPGALPEGLPNKSDAEEALNVLDRIHKVIKKN